MKFSKATILLFFGLFSIFGCSQGGNSSNQPTGNNPIPSIPNPPVNIHFSSAGQTVISKACSTPVSVETIDLNNSPANVNQNTTLSLSGSGILFFSDSNCSTQISSTLINAGKSKTQFYVKAPNLGNLIITVAESTFGQIFQQLTSTVGPASALIVSTQPTNSIAGQTFGSFSVQVQDYYGNNVNQSGVAVSLSLNTPNTFAYGTTTVSTTTSGIAQFNDISMHQSGTFSFNFAANGFLPANSNSFKISSNSAVRVVFYSMPSGGTANQFFNPIIQVAASDSYGNVVTSISSKNEQVTLTAYSDNTCATATGTVSSNVGAITNGIAKFVSATFNQFGTTYFKAVSTSFGQTCSPAVSINPQLGLIKSSINLDSGGSFDVGSVVKGGVAPYSYSLTQSTIGSTLSEIGFYTAGNNSSMSPYSEVVTVTDNQNNKISFTANVYQALSLEIPNTTMVAGTTQTLTGSGGLAPYSYSLSSGGGSFDSNGSLTAAQTPGDIIVKVSDANGSSSSYLIHVVAGMTANATSFNVFVNQSQQISVSGGIAPYSYSILSGPGSLNGSGLFQASSTSGVTKINVTDSKSNSILISINTYSGGATHLAFSAQPSNGVIGENLATMPILLALNDKADVDYTYSGIVPLELWDQTCSNKITDQAISFNSNSFTNGRFQPEVLKIYTSGTFTLKVTMNSFSACSSSFVVSGSNHKVYVGQKNICKIDNGTLQCLGANDLGQLTSNQNPYSETLSPIATSALVSEVSIGSNHICAIDDGKLKCWGSNAFGQLGSSPSSVSSKNSVSLVNGIATNSYGLATGAKHSCSIIGASINCWGNDDNHQLGRGSPSSGPVINCLNITNQNTCQNVGCQVADPCSGFTTASSCSSNNQCSFDFATAICHNTSSQTACQGSTSYSCEMISSQTDCANLGCDWSNNSCYTANSNFSASGYTPSPVLGLNGIVSSISGSENTNCAISENEVFCWGDNSSKQTGQTAIRIDAGNKVANLENSTQVSVGLNHSCSVNNSQPYCWGANNKGQLGQGSTSTTPNNQAQSVNVSNVKKVANGNSFSCALTSGGSVYCWGANDQSQLGLGTVTTQEASPKLLNLSGVIDISAGGSAACAVKSDFSLACWGFNNFGHSESANPINYSSPTIIH
jgi:alpha-tubulin suppressor-like RCC1 family protein